MHSEKLALFTNKLLTLFVFRANADRYASRVKPMIARLQGEGKGLREMARVLNAEGRPTPRGKEWTPTVIKNALAR